MSIRAVTNANLEAGALSSPSGSAAHPLDNAVFASLTGAHAHLAERRGNAARYPVDVSPFAALPTHPEVQDWLDLEALAGPGAVVVLVGLETQPPQGWEIVARIAGAQLIDDGVAAKPDDGSLSLTGAGKRAPGKADDIGSLSLTGAGKRAPGQTDDIGSLSLTGAGKRAPGKADDVGSLSLTSADVPEILDLVRRTEPGPFLPRTVALGTYLGIRRNGALVAMAGERLHPPGWTEISAVCTHAAFRGQGLATRLVLAVADGIRKCGETPFLHAAASNTNAIRLYESLGFRLRHTPAFQALRRSSR